MEPVDVSYDDVGLLQRKILSDFLERSTWYGDPHDLESVLHDAFLYAYDKYDGDRAKFASFVGYVTKMWLKRLRQERAVKAAKNPTVSGNLRIFDEDATELFDTLPAREETGFDVASFLFDLSEDAAEAVKLCLGMFPHPKEKKGRPSGTRAALLERALRKLGWSNRRICKTFDEVKEALA